MGVAVATGVAGVAVGGRVAVAVGWWGISPASTWTSSVSSSSALIASLGHLLVAIGLIVNILAYPAVVAVSYWGLGVRRLAPGEHAAEARLV